jgi:hypothetical protein
MGKADQQDLNKKRNIFLEFSQIKNNAINNFYK